MTCRYTEFDAAPTSTHSRIVELVPRGARVLEFGCATGYMSRVLKERLGCSVTGIEIDPEAARSAEAHCQRVIVGDAEELHFEELFGDERFDVVLFADVLEHLKDPAAVLLRVRPFVAEGGAVVASIPNVAHGSVRLALLAGQFQYRERGLLDASHVRFFTRDSVQDLFEESGYVITNWVRQRVELGESEIAVPPLFSRDSIQELLARDPESTTYQFIVRAVSSDEASKLAAAHQELREAREELEDTRPLRKALEGLEAELAEARAELEALRPLRQAVEELEGAREELDALRRAHEERGRRLVAERLEFANELGELQRHLEALHRSRSFRYTAVFRKFFGVFRGGR
jgi:SAM-dependent methyltransferase